MTEIKKAGPFFCAVGKTPQFGADFGTADVYVERHVRLVPISV